MSFPSTIYMYPYTRTIVYSIYTTGSALTFELAFHHLNLLALVASSAIAYRFRKCPIFNATCFQLEMQNSSLLLSLKERTAPGSTHFSVEW